MASSPTQPDEQNPREESPTSIVHSLKQLSQFRYSRAFSRVVPVTAAYTVQTEEDRIILADASGGAFTVTLPSADAADEVEYTVKKTDSSSNAVTVVALDGSTFDGAVSIVLVKQSNLVRAASDQTNYFITGASGILVRSFESAEFSIAVTTNFDVAHGLGGVPQNTVMYLRCKITEHGYSIDDEININGLQGGVSQPRGITGGSNATNMYGVVGGQTFRILTKTTGALVTPTDANWRFFGRCQR